MRTAKFITATTKLIMGLVLMVTLAGAAFAEPVVIYTGTKGGGYDAKAKTIAARVSQRGVEVVIENRKGSDDITLQACANENSIWISQHDALWKREMTDGCYLSVLADYGDEIAMLLFPPGSENSKLSHLDADDQVFVTGIGSGSELTWKNFQAIEKEHGRSDEWSDAQIVTGDIRRLNALANRGKVSAAFLVNRPGSNNILRLIEAGWSVGTLSDKDIDDLQWGDHPLYEKVKYSIPGVRGSNRGYRVPSFIGTTEAVEADNPELFDALLSALE